MISVVITVTKMMNINIRIGIIIVLVASGLNDDVTNAAYAPFSCFKGATSATQNPRILCRLLALIPRLVDGREDGLRNHPVLRKVVTSILVMKTVLYY